MREHSPVFIVSAFGRGNILAQSLNSQEIPVRLIDVSKSLGDTKIEDNEGPFGFFSQGLTNIESQRLRMDHPAYLQDHGFVTMLPDGPLEFQGSLTNFRLQQQQIPEKVWSWINGAEKITSQDHSRILNDDFEKNWIFHLARSFSTNQWVPNYRAGLVEGFIPQGESFYVRSVDRNVSEEALKSLLQEGVKVEFDAEVLDLVQDGSKLTGIELKRPGSGSSEVVTLEKVIWFLSGEETEKLSGKLKDKLFPHGVLKPVGSWVRSRLKITSSAQRDVLPLHSLWMQNRALPWTHSNLFVLQRTQNQDLFDLWFRVPESFRFLKDYLNEVISEIQQTLTQRMSLDLDSITLHETPVSMSKSSSEIGPSRHPLFDSRDWLEVKRSGFKNMEWVSVETQDGLGWNYQVKASRTVFERLTLWWTERERLRKKQELEQARKNAKAGPKDNNRGTS